MIKKTLDALTVRLLDDRNEDTGELQLELTAKGGNVQIFNITEGQAEGLRDSLIIRTEHITPAAATKVSAKGEFINRLTDRIKELGGDGTRPAPTSCNAEKQALEYLREFAALGGAE